MATHFKEDALLDKLGGIALNADAVSWLLKPKDFKQALLTKIASATSSIYIASLYV
jgi:CDP-diacylglycerol--serine O-phosphatidyltransferase